jgi:hypothetical protein
MTAIQLIKIINVVIPWVIGFSAVLYCQTLKTHNHEIYIVV